ncbi:MAG: hypothetical protein OEY10_00420 [Nitrosopumilus sp.]|nr:hypothetical protein [Nitrosopumilus sp.]
MKKYIFILCSIFLATNAHAIKLTDIPALPSTSDADIYPTEQSSVAYKATLLQLRSHAGTAEASDIVIGGTYAGAQTAPTDGLRVEGPVTFGATTELSRNHFTLIDTAAETSAAAFYLVQDSGNYNAVYGLNFVHTDNNSNGGSYAKYGINGLIQNTNGGAFGNTSALNGAWFQAYNRSNATVAVLRGLYATIGNSGTGTGASTNNYGAHLNFVKAGGSLTNVRAIYTTGVNSTNYYGLYLDTATCATTCYDIYASNSGSDNYFAGKIGAGTNAPTEALDVNADTIRIRTARTPATSAEACNTGEMAWDTSYIYICTTTNTWKRATLNAF